MAEEDIISSLPDHLLLEIISRIKIMDKQKQEERLMSTTEVIQTTTTISKRWQHLWTRLPSLVFLDDDVRGYFPKNFPKYLSVMMIGRGYCKKVLPKYLSFIDKTLTQCPTHVNLQNFTLEIVDVQQPSQVNSWIRYAITRNVQEIVLRITGLRFEFCDDDLFFNNSCLHSMVVSNCEFKPPNGTIRWDKLKFLRIDKGILDQDLLRKILSGSPCLETLELNDCHLSGRIPKSLFGNFGVLESLFCDLATYERFSYDDELFVGNSNPTSMKLSRCVFNPPTGTIGCDKLKFLCIEDGELDEDSIEDILSESPFLETLQLSNCCGFDRIDITSKSVKNLVLSGYEYTLDWLEYYIDTLEINAPYISSLTVEGKMYLEKFMVENVSSLVKADLNFWVCDRFADEVLELDRDDMEEDLLEGLLSGLGHVNEIALGTLDHCLTALSRLEDKGFQFRKHSYERGIWPNKYRVFSLIQK